MYIYIYVSKRFLVGFRVNSMPFCIINTIIPSSYSKYANKWYRTPHDCVPDKKKRQRDNYHTYYKEACVKHRYFSAYIFRRLMCMPVWSQLDICMFQHGVGVEFVRVLPETYPPTLSNIFCECDSKDDVVRRRPALIMKAII